MAGFRHVRARLFFAPGAFTTSVARVITTTVPRAFLQSGANTIAVKVLQDGAANNWTANPTFFQAVLTVPTEDAP